MIGSIITFLERRSAALVSALGLTSLAAVASLDYHLNDQLSFSLFYLIPISVIALYAGRAASLAFCAFSAAVATLIGQSSPGVHPGGWALAWNTFVNFGSFAVTALLVAALKTHLTSLDALRRKDDLTGVFNLGGFKEEAHGRLMLADRYKHPMAIGRVDVVGFKALVDTKGRAEGTTILKEVADIISGCVRSTDIVGRLSSDEFIVLLPETDYEGAQTMFKRIHEALDRHAAERDSPVSFNISVAAYKNAPSTIDEALQYVDRIMYRLRQTGKMDILYEEQIGANWGAYHER